MKRFVKGLHSCSLANISGFIRNVNMDLNWNVCDNKVANTVEIKRAFEAGARSISKMLKRNKRAGNVQKPDGPANMKRIKSDHVGQTDPR